MPLGGARKPHHRAAARRRRLTPGFAVAPTAHRSARAGHGRAGGGAVGVRQDGARCSIPALLRDRHRLRPPGARGVLIGSIRRAVAAARLSDLRAATELGEPDSWVERLLDALAAGGEGVLLVLDDAHHLQAGDGHELVVRLARGIAAPNRLLILGRSFTGPLEALWRDPRTVRVDGAELAFTAPEARALLSMGGREVGEHELSVALETTQGWATALALLASARPEACAAHGGDPVAAPLRSILALLNDVERDAAVQLAHLPVLSPELCAALGTSFETLVSAGLPLGRTDSGWWELPSPVAARLAAHAPLRATTARVAVEAYEVEGESLRALRLLVGAGLHEEAARRLAQSTATAVEALGLGVVHDLVDSLPGEVVQAHPRVLLHLARLAEVAQQRAVRAQALSRARTVIADERLRREFEAERARDLMWDERTRAQARTTAEGVLAAADASEEVARARALDVLGRLASWFSPSGPQPEAETLLLESVRLARRMGQATWTAQALVALGAGFYFALCRYE